MAAVIDTYATSPFLPLSAYTLPPPVRIEAGLMPPGLKTAWPDVLSATAAEDLDAWGQTPHFPRPRLQPPASKQWGVHPTQQVRQQQQQHQPMLRQQRRQEQQYQVAQKERHVEQAPPERQQGSYLGNFADPLGSSGSAGELVWACARIKLESPSFGKQSEPLIIFDWDDTLCPSTVLIQEEHRYGGRSTPTSPFAAAARERQLASCAAAAAQVLHRAKQVGRVVIITNALQGWVEASATRYLPEILPELEGVPVVSARSIYEPKGIDSPALWKSLCFQRVARCLQVQDWLRGKRPREHTIMVSIGDSVWERSAAWDVVREPSLQWNASTVKLNEHPGIRELTRELELLSEELMCALVSSESLDLRVSDGFQLEVDRAT